MRKKMAATPVALLAVILLAGGARATEDVDFVRWQGGNGDWTATRNWEAWGENIAERHDQFARDVLWFDRGTRGLTNRNRPNPGEDYSRWNRGGETIILDDGTVDFNSIGDVNGTGPFYDDFHVFRGSNLVIRDGAVWSQATLPTWTENRWTKIDADNFILDGGTFRRTGSTPSEHNTGGALAFGLRGGDADYESELGAQVMNIELKNGGRIENEGQLWFGYWRESGFGMDNHDYPFTIAMTIKDGSLDLTGGDIPVELDQPADGDLMFVYMYSDDFKPERKPTYSINFTGPGTITVDQGGIRNISTIASVQYVDPGPQSYQDLWDAGILQANGLSGVDGEDFSDYFTVNGNVGDENYTLTSRFIKGDVNFDYEVNGLDVDPFVDALVSATYNALADMNDDDQVNGLDVEPFVDALVSGLNSAPFAAADAHQTQSIPEPATLALALAALGLCLKTRFFP